MKITLPIYIYIVSDKFGDFAYDVVKDPSDEVWIYGIKNSENKSVAFENDAYKLSRWCVENGLKLRIIKKEIEESFKLEEVF